MAVDLEGAVKAHADWKVKLRAAIARHDTLDARSISRDNVCPLGQWLHGDAKQELGDSPMFRDVLAKHATFHRCAGDVALAINSEKFAEAEAMLANGTPFARASMDVSVALTKLRKECEQ